MSNNQTTTSNNPLDIFITGARKGFNVAVNNLVPNVMMAYVIAHILHILGVMDFLGHYCAPIMGIFGLPGESIMVLLTAWLSGSAGVGIAANLVAHQIIGSNEVAILLPAIFLMGSQLQYMGRLLGVADCPKKYWPLLMLISILNAVIAMFVMRLFV